MVFRVRGGYVAKIPIRASLHFDESGTMTGSGASRFIHAPENPAEDVRSVVQLLRVSSLVVEH